MKLIRITLIICLLSWRFPSRAQDNYKMTGNYSFIVRGSSNIRDWAETVYDVEGTAYVNRKPDQAEIIEMRLLFRVYSIKSIGVEGNVMNEKTYETLKAGVYPSITFIITSPVNPVLTDGKRHFVEASGLLTIANISKIMKLHPAVSFSLSGIMTAEGSVFLRMSDFGLTPPVTLFGLLKVRDDVVVDFKITMEPHEMTSENRKKVPGYSLRIPYQSLLLQRKSQSPMTFISN